MSQYAPVRFVNVRLEGEFWKERLETVLKTTIPSQHKKLGEYYLDLKQPQRALPAFLAQLASKPVDPAGAYYNLARTYVALSRRTEAQEALFQSLEAAPGYKPAQKLLLDLENQSKKD